MTLSNSFVTQKAQPRLVGYWLKTCKPSLDSSDWGRREHLSQLWEDLCWLRQESIVLFSSQREWRVLLELPVREPRRLSDERQLLLRRSLSGESQKAIAIGGHRASSTVCAQLSGTLSSIGLTGRWRRGLLLFAMAANALAASFPLYTNTHDFTWRGRRWRSFGAERPNLEFHTQASPAEVAVGQLLVEGLTHVEIAEQRKTSIRTVANQIGALFKKHGVSGRGELVQDLVSRRVSGAIASQRAIEYGRAESQSGDFPLL